MATNPSNANSGLPKKEAAAPDSGFPDASAVTSATDRREALQALLAFSTLHEQIRRRRAEEALRYAAGLAPSHDPWEFEQFLLDEVLQLVAERALAITGADGIAIALAEGEEIICRASSGSMAPDRGVRLDAKAGFSGTCFRTGRIARCDDSEKDSRVNVAACRRLGTRSMVAVPLLGQGGVLGLLEAFSTEPFGFDDGDVRSLNLLAELILAALKPEDEDRIVRAAKVAAAELQSGELDKLRQIPMSPPPPVTVPSTSSDEQNAPLEFSKDDIAPDLYQSDSSGSIARMVAVLSLVLAVVLIGGGLWWWRLQGISHVGAANNSPSPANGGATTSPASLTNVVSPALDAPPIALPPIPNALKGAAPVLVTSIHPSTSEGVSTVAIDLQSPVQYRKNRLPNPERIYFDLLNTSLAPGMNGQIIEVKDGLIGRIRVAQTSDNVTRVVLEIKSGATFWDDLDEAHHKLVIEVRDHEAAPQSQPTLEPTAPPATESTKNIAPPVTPATNEGTATPKFRVVLDAGHGGWDLGTVGRGGLVEKTLVLEVAQRLGNMLETKLGAEVTYTRGDDNYVPLEQRAEIANKAKADLFISVHANYSTLETARGVETYYSSFFSPPEAREIEFRENATAQSVDHAKLSGAQLKSKVEQSRKLASSVQSALYGTLVSQNKGIRNRGVKEASFVVLSGTEMPSILAEISFVSSPADEERLQSADYREQIAQALFKGIEHYASNAKGVKIASASGRPSGR